jgi:hypothetical protein
MVTPTHEASHRLFQEHPEALTPVFESLGIPPPSKSEFDTLSPDATEIRPLERRVDTVLKFEPEMGESFLLAIEAQTKKHPDKPKSWAYYVAHLRAKYDMPVLLVAVCRDKPTATWAAGPLLEMVARGFLTFAPPITSYWTEVVEVGLESTPVKEKWRTLMENVITHFPGHRTMFEEKYLEGEAQGKAEDRASLILRVLEKRGIEVPDGVRERITSCTDLDTLTDWFDRSLSAAGAEDLFTEGVDSPVDEEAYLEARALGEIRGTATGVLRVLEVRGLAISDDVREHIMSCTDLQLVDDWLERAGTVERAEDLFTEPESGSRQ